MDTRKEAKLKGPKEIEKTMTLDSSSKVNSKKGLNPLAKEWDPVKERAPEESRCLYLAFSSWHPLNEDEIIFFFHQMYGKCVEKVSLQGPQEKKGAMIFGKVVFHFSSIPASVLGKQDQVMNIVNSKWVWCLRFDPLNQNNEE